MAPRLFTSRLAPHTPKFCNSGNVTVRRTSTERSTPSLVTPVSISSTGVLQKSAIGMIPVLQYKTEQHISIYTVQMQYSK